MKVVLAEILGPDMLIILAMVALLFGSTRLPKLARSLGSAKSEFEKGLRESSAIDAAPVAEQPTTPPADTSAKEAPTEESPS